MPMQTIKGGAWIPNRPPHLSAALSFTTVSLNSTDAKLAFIIQNPKRALDPVTGNPITITKVCFYVLNSSGGSFDIRLETVNATTGHPTGTLWALNTNKVQSLPVGWQTTTLDAAADVPVGEYLAIVIVRQSGSADFATINPSACAQEFPYSDNYISTIWTKLQNCPVCALGYSDGSYEVVQGAWPIQAVNNVSFNSTTSPFNQRGLRFKVPFPTRAVGAWVWADIDGDANLRLYDNVAVPLVPTPLATVSLDKDRRFGPTYARQVYYFDAKVALIPQVEYFLALEPGATSVILNEVDVNSAAVMDAMDGGREFHFAGRTGTGAFTMTATKRPMMGLIFDRFSDENLDYFDVTAFGAVGNGIADDTLEIQAAINAADDAGPGSTVFIPEGIYLVDVLTLAGDHLTVTGGGTLKLKAASNATAVLTVSGDYNLISGIRIDGNRAGSPGGEGSGLVMTGDYNHARDVYASNTKVSSSSAAFRGEGTHNLFEGCWSENAGGDAFADTGDYNRYQDCTAKNWGNAGFHRASATLTRQRLDIDGGYFEPGADSLDNNCMLFDGSSGKTQMVAIRNTVVNWPDNQTPAGTTQLLGKFARIDWLILDNCLFKHKNTATTMLTTVEIGANVKRACLDHCFLSRQLKLNAIDSDAIVMLTDTQIGDDQLWALPNTRPTVSVLGIDGAQFIARASRFIGYTVAALELVDDLASGSSTLVHFEASDCEFQGRGDNATTYDVTTSGSGAVNKSGKLLWLNNRRSNGGTGNAKETILNSNQRILFTTRDWSKKVYESNAIPSTTDVTWQRGDTSMHTAPATPGIIGWVFAGNGGNQWKSFGTIT